MNPVLTRSNSTAREVSLGNNTSITIFRTNPDQVAHPPLQPPSLTKNWSGSPGNNRAGTSSGASITSRPLNNRVDPLPVLRIPQNQGYTNHGPPAYEENVPPPPSYEDVIGNEDLEPPRPSSASYLGMKTLGEAKKYSAK